MDYELIKQPTMEEKVKVATFLKNRWPIYVVNMWLFQELYKTMPLIHHVASAYYHSSACDNKHLIYDMTWFYPKKIFKKKFFCC